MAATFIFSDEENLIYILSIWIPGRRDGGMGEICHDKVSTFSRYISGS
jgi:hypothetical protein